MSKPVILTVDDDPMVSAAITHDLRSHCGAGSGAARVAPAVGDGAMSICLVHRHLATI